MAHKLYRVTDFKVVGTYDIWVRFDDNTEQVINFEPVLYGQIWEPLRDPQVFRRVKLDPIAWTLTWPNGVDFDAETLRNWPDYKDELAQRAQPPVRVYA